MKKLTSYEEIENLCDAAVRDYMRRKHYTNSRCVDIEEFATDYLGLQIVYEKICEPDYGRIGYLSDGVRPIWVRRSNRRMQVLFPENVVVIDDSMMTPTELARRRFTIAHEAGHFILSQHVPAQSKAAFHSEFDAEMTYTKEMFREMMTMTEAFANFAGGCLLMPMFLVDRTLRKYNNGNKILAYDNYVLPQESKLVIQSMADSLGVNYTPCATRLRELNLYDIHPIEEYLGSTIYHGPMEVM